jgi:hypothetical protein
LEQNIAPIGELCAIVTVITMQRILLLVAILLILLCQVGYSQQIKVYNRYFSAGSFPIGGETLTLASNGIYYHSYSAELMALVSKGTWKESAGKLQLRAWPAKKIYPKPVFEFKNGNDSNITISVKDVFGLPFNGFGLALIREDDTRMEHPEYIFLDSSGKLVLGKEDYLGFYMLYQYGDSKAEKYDNDVTVHAFNHQIDEIIISIAFDGCAPLDRGINFLDYNKQLYQIKDDGLYSKGNLVFKKVSVP